MTINTRQENNVGLVIELFSFIKIIFEDKFATYNNS